MRGRAGRADVVVSKEEKVYNYYQTTRMSPVKKKQRTGSFSYDSGGPVQTGFQITLGISICTHGSGPLHKVGVVHPTTIQIRCRSDTLSCTSLVRLPRNSRTRIV